MTSDKYNEFVMQLLVTTVIHAFLETMSFLCAWFLVIFHVRCLMKLFLEQMIPDTNNSCQIFSYHVKKCFGLGTFIALYDENVNI